MATFFISYTGADAGWAEWIGWVLEEANHDVIVQAWDFGPGSNFVLEMQKAATQADRIIVVLSPDYPESKFAAPEWAAVFARDPDGMKRLVVPVRVRECQVNGMFKPIVYIDLVGLDPDAARRKLVDGIRTERGKPTQAPVFPGQTAGPVKASSPEQPRADTGTARPETRAYMPNVRRSFTDLAKARFLKTSFQTIQAYFERALAQLRNEYPGEFDGEITEVSAEKFTAEIFVREESRCWCKVWLGGGFGGIAFSESKSYGDHDNSMNESLSVQDDGPELSLKTMMGFGFGSGPSKLQMDPEHLTPEQAGEYLWRRLVSRLER